MLNTDYTQRVVLDTLALPWQASPSPQVWRRQLERDGGECARATSIVRYDPGARFPEHGHELGEEIIVLLCGGDKSTQDRDIRKAKEIAEDWRDSHGQA